MGRIKDIEHDGWEQFDSKDKSDRKKVRTIERGLEEALKQGEEEAKAQAQRDYLQHSNPALWEGDFDED